MGGRQLAGFRSLPLGGEASAPPAQLSTELGGLYMERNASPPTVERLRKLGALALFAWVLIVALLRTFTSKATACCW